MLNLLIFKHLIHSHPFCSFQLSLHLWFDEVSIKCDVNIHIVTVDGIFPLMFEKPDPDLVTLLQRQHDTLALHNGAVTGLSVNDGLRVVILHDVQVRLLKVPRVDIHIEEVDSCYVATEFSGKHIKVFGSVHKDGIKDQGLVVVDAVK